MPSLLPAVLIQRWCVADQTGRDALLPGLGQVIDGHPWSPLVHLRRPGNGLILVPPRAPTPAGGMRTHAAGRCQLVAALVDQQVPGVVGSRSASARIEARAAFLLPRCLTPRLQALFTASARVRARPLARSFVHVGAGRPVAVRWRCCQRCCRQRLCQRCARPTGRERPEPLPRVPRAGHRRVSALPDLPALRCRGPLGCVAPQPGATRDRFPEAVSPGASPPLA